MTDNNGCHQTSEGAKCLANRLKFVVHSNNSGGILLSTKMCVASEAGPIARFAGCAKANVDTVPYDGVKANAKWKNTKHSQFVEEKLRSDFAIVWHSLLLSGGDHGQCAAYLRPWHRPRNFGCLLGGCLVFYIGQRQEQRCTVGMLMAPYQIISFNCHPLSKKTTAQI